MRLNLNIARTPQFAVNRVLPGHTSFGTSVFNIRWGYSEDPTTSQQCVPQTGSMVNQSISTLRSTSLGHTELLPTLPQPLSLRLLLRQQGI